MSALLKDNFSIFHEIAAHPTWQGNVSGLVAEKMIDRSQTPFLYLLRAGEHKGDYYITYVDADLTVRHQPFIILANDEGWSYRQGGGKGPFPEDHSINEVIHLLMHCEADQCKPFVKA